MPNNTMQRTATPLRSSGVRDFVRARWRQDVGRRYHGGVSVADLLVSTIGRACMTVRRALIARRRGAFHVLARPHLPAFLLLGS